MIRFSCLATIKFLAALAVMSVPLSMTLAQPVKVSVQESASGWQLVRDGKPYYINGAGGMGSLSALSNCGGNSTRTWGVDDVDESTRRLNDAHELGISVAFGIWIEHERHGFDYSNQAALKTQKEQTLAHVKRFKDHPAVLIWGIGNEMEGEGANPAIWKHIEEIAQDVKKEDPHHPVMTVIAEIGGQKVQSIHKYCPSVDIIGINTYGGTDSLPTRYRDAGGTKPYIVTEFGPNGPWEVGKNSVGTVDEPSSTQKAAKYRQSWTALKKDAALCLGSYAFLWGHKQEATDTWFGLFLRDGRKTSAVDTLTELWGGKPASNQCPTISRLAVQGPNEVKPGQMIKVNLQAEDPDGDNLQVDWVVMAEANTLVTGGDFQEAPETLTECVLQSDSRHAVIQAPAKVGLYRVYAYVGDGQQAAATANVSLRVTQEPSEGPQGEQTTLPFVVFDEPETNSGYVPSGWMGNTASITMDEKCTTQPQTGDHCLKFGYADAGQWGGVVWQNPADDWGEQPGGFDLSNAKRLTF